MQQIAWKYNLLCNFVYLKKYVLQIFPNFQV